MSIISTMLAKFNFSVFRQFSIMAFFEVRLSRFLSAIFSRPSSMFSSSSLMLLHTPHSHCLARGFLFLLAGISLLVLTACAGGGGGSSSAGGSASAFKVELTFSPTANGFVIGNQSDFGNFVSLNITATTTSRGGRVIEDAPINIASEFIDSSYSFVVPFEANWTFEIIGTLSDGRQEPIEIVFVWPENEEDHKSGGIHSGLDTDGDRRANSVDDDDDNDNVTDGDDDCPVGDIDWTSNSSTDNDNDGCRDESIEDTDDDNDGVEDGSDDCSSGETGWESNPTTDNDGDGCLDDSSEDTDDDNDDLNDGNEREQLSVGGVSCQLLADCDGDTVTDKDEVAVNCVIEADCDYDGVRDGDEEAGCVENTDCDTDGVGDAAEARGCAKLEDCDMDGEMDGTDIDDDGDGLIEIAMAAEFDAVRHQLDGTGRKLSADATLNQTGCGGGQDANGVDITSCSGYELVADISLATYADDEGGKGWQPLGHDTNTNTDDCQGAAFAGIFEGNGWTISGLNISRSGEDCVGLFGHIAADATIRNLILHAKTVIGRRLVGGLVGVMGTEADIYSSSVVVGEVSGTGNVIGGLVGDSRSARIVSSSVVAAEVSGDSFVGGLAGVSQRGQIYSSSVVVGVVSADGTGPLRPVGGLVGDAQLGQIYSSSVVVDELSGTDSGQVSGLSGNSINGKVAYSYVVSGSDTNMLVGTIGTVPEVASYWDSNTSGVTSGNTGDPKTTSELRNPTGYADIYDSWDDETVMFSDGPTDEPLAVWCDRDNSGAIESAERDPSNLIWDFGDSDEYPAIRCTPLAPDEWRDWWSLDGNGKPQLNQMLLDNTLNP